jgi:hypothetical protein
MNSVKTGAIGRISLICVPTREQDRAIAFYESLGFEKRTDITFGPGSLGGGLSAAGHGRYRACAAAGQ